MNNRIKSAFDHVHAEEPLKRRTEEFLLREISARTRKKQRTYRRLIPALASFLLILAGLGGGSWLYFTPTSAICIDTDAPVELKINRFDKVIAIESSDSSLEDTGIRFMDCAEAVELLLTDESIAAYLEEEDLTIVVAGGSGEQNGRVVAKVSACTNAQQNVYCCAGSDEELAAAEEAGLPYGKYLAYLELQALEPSVTPEELRSMSLRAIREWIASLSGDSSGDSLQEDSGQQNGQGAQNGQGYQNGQGAQDGQGYQNGQGTQDGQGYQNGQGAHDGQGYQGGRGNGTGAGQTSQP